MNDTDEYINIDISEHQPNQIKVTVHINRNLCKIFTLYV